MSERRRIGVLTSSRADYGIYKPLLLALSKSQQFDLIVICFGMHLLEKFGLTINEIKQDKFGEIITVGALSEGDTKSDVVKNYGNTVKNFHEVWDNNHYDLVFALGDRYEMSAAVQSTIPYEIKVAHIHGGETTLGAIDNIYRHQITLAATYHFPSTDYFGKKIAKITGTNENIFPVGSISLDGVDHETIPFWNDVADRFAIPKSKSYVLVTVHPETVNSQVNSRYATVIGDTLLNIANDFHIVITMPNADTTASSYRKKFRELKQAEPNSFSLVESFGRQNYFSAMKNAEYLLGNTSSGIIEAASFGKFVINVGDRQKGRLRSDNVIDVPFDQNQILISHKKLIKRKGYTGGNKYHKPNTVSNIIKIINEKL
ncbi:MAG: UDP-N-acetylglucosamine 2-epimerase [Fulvivirga sp.]|uniref:UDP-N-acetylglucosamine 2-epimerase n=1 Tax=Fulvivirga sp. TaxID=1931237 RepID=UPI0032EDEB84